MHYGIWAYKYKTGGRVSPLEGSWIWDGVGDPGRILLGKLGRLIGARGFVLAYGAAFEKARLLECASAHPEFAGRGYNDLDIQAGR